MRGIYLDIAMQWVTLASSYGDLGFSMLYKASLTCTVKCRFVSMQHMQVEFGSTPCSLLTVQHSVVDKGVDEHFFQFLLEVLNIMDGIIPCSREHVLYSLCGTRPQTLIFIEDGKPLKLHQSIFF